MSRSSGQRSQNLDNFITDKPSTHVYKAPGGGSTAGSLIYGGNDEGPAPSSTSRRRSYKNSEVTSVFGSTTDGQSYAGETYQKKPIETPESHDTKYNAKESNPLTSSYNQSATSSSNQFASGANQNSGNVITGRRTTRVHAPPGGTSSFSLGWK